MERVVNLSHESGASFDTISKTSKSTRNVSLPRLRFSKAVGVFLKKHNTPSQEFHQEKRGRLGMGSHLGICWLREHAVLSSTNEDSRQETLWGPEIGSPGSPRTRKWLRTGLLVSTAETQIEATNLQHTSPRQKKKKKKEITNIIQ